MRRLMETELFPIHVKNLQELSAVFNVKLAQDEGVIAPEHIAPELSKLRPKQSLFPLGAALTAYEQFNGKIKLFDLSVQSHGRPHVPSFIPFYAGNSRNRANENSETLRGVSPAIYFNMYRIGRWSADEKQYTGLSAVTDLRAVLESAFVAYRLTIDNKSKKVFENTKILESLSKIYTYMFTNAIIRAGKGVFGDYFNEDLGRFIISKFFLLYVLKKSDSDTIDQIAYKSVKFRTTFASLKTSEELTGISFDSLSKFLETFGQHFFMDPISLVSFTTSWMAIYGESLLLAIEYVPYLIHFLIATHNGALLGGSNKLYRKWNDLVKEGLPKLVTEILSEIR
jgi:hypothetical protein